MECSNGERGFVNKVSWAICWLKKTRVWDNLKRRSDIIELKMMIMILKVNYKCQSGRKCNRVGFYTIWYVGPWKTEVVGFSTSVGSSWIFLIVPESTYEGGVCSAHRLCVDLVMGNHTCDMVCTSPVPYDTYKVGDENIVISVVINY